MATNSQTPVTIDILLRLVPDSPDTVLTHLQSHPNLASAADSTGYSLLHAAASYSQLPLLRALVNDHNADVNITDEEGETPLFAAETLAAAQCLLEELGANPAITNEEGATAEDNALASMDDGGEWPQVADYLERRRTNAAGGAPAPAGTAAAPPSVLNGDIGNADIDEVNGDADDAVRAPPPLPPNVRINMGTMPEPPLDGEGAPDPEFRRRIEELAAREDFQGEEGQKELRELVTEAVGGLTELSSGGRDVRRRKD